ncbi:Sodium/calcium exchanger protein-domain-containing protein [Jimgerdemannia flammicorona]|uniref:Sodium/calcium exchanger protein-domain-containing protein n=1 Tax=Jimgerdemannia flammicorona TaxID=994334 RepID=A0A433Q830_9FUNG|nr:Sodium/calcium exchanger protein-domain-containing protein [Jimgerdemannia flammicorona]
MFGIDHLCWRGLGNLGHSKSRPLTVSLLRPSFPPRGSFRQLCHTPLKVAWLFFLFGFVGIAASDFFCPNLQTIASSLNLSESMAGVTFLAFGNGSPDVFSTFSAMKAQSGSLAIGELIGAASFIASVVAGSMAVVAPFRVSRLPFLRDLSFFMCAILIVVAIVWDGKIYLYESVILIAFYAIYVAVVVVGNVWWRRNHEQRELMKRAREGFGEMGPEALTLFDTIQSRMNMSDDDEPLSRFYDDEIDGIFPSSPRPLSASSPGSDQLRFAFDHRAPQAMSSHIMGRRPGIRPSFFGAIEFRDVVHSLEKTNLRYGHPNDQYRTDFRRRYSTMPANIDSTRPHFLADPQSLMARPSYAADAIITAARTGDDYFTSSQIRSSSPIGEASGTDDDMDLEESSNIPRITVNTITSLTPPGFSRTTFPSGSPLISPLHSHRPISRPISPLHPPSTPLSPLLSPTSSRPMSPYPPHESHLLDTRVAKVAHVLALEPYDLEVVLRTLFPSLQGWTEKSMSGKITSLVATPILLVLRLTLPVVDDEGLQPNPYDYEDEDGETAGLLARESANNVFVEDVDEDADGQGKIGWCQWLTALQLVFAPVFVVTVLATDGFVDYIAIAWALLGGALAMLLLLLTTRPQHRPPFFKLVSFVGFAISITWIYIIANEVVGVLQVLRTIDFATFFICSLIRAIGHIVGLSEAILGLTVFAMGNSLGDFVANVTIAKMGSPMMAISACFGGPIHSARRGHQRDIHDQHHGRAVQHRYRAHHSGVIGWAAGGSVLITRPCAEEWIQDHEKFWICVDRDIYCVQRDQRVA